MAVRSMAHMSLFQAAFFSCTSNADAISQAYCPRRVLSCFLIQPSTVLGYVYFDGQDTTPVSVVLHHEHAQALGISYLSPRKFPC
jgi:hypothetical protein